MILIAVWLGGFDYCWSHSAWEGIVCADAIEINVFWDYYTCLCLSLLQLDFYSACRSDLIFVYFSLEGIVVVWLTESNDAALLACL